MKIKEFIENEINVDVITTRYMPVMKKQEICREVLENCVENVNGFLTINKTKGEVLITMMALQYYTNLKCGKKFEAVVKDYDLLCINNKLKDLIFEIGEDFSVLMGVYEQESKIVLERNSVEAQVANVTNKLTQVIDDLKDKLVGAIGDYNLNDIIPEGTDMEALMDFVKEYRG